MERTGELRFDNWTLTVATGELRRGDSCVRLQEQPLQVLLALLEQPGELVTREQLIGRLWPKGVIEFDTALNSAVRRLRRALGDEADTPRYIETIPRRGYRFLAGAASPASPSRVPDVEVPVPGRHGALSDWVVAAIALVAVAVGWGAWSASRELQNDFAAALAESRPSIAVLAFTDLSARGDHEYFADGIAEEVLNLLAQSPELLVTARTSSFAFKDQRSDIGTIAERLGVRHVLEGSVRRAGDRVRVTAQLIDVATNAHIWSHTYDRALGDILDVQTEIASEVAGALQVALVDVGAPRAAPGLAAQDHYHRARYFHQRRAPGDLERARLNYQLAIENANDYGRAWAGLASVYWLQKFSGELDHATSLARARDAAQRALELDPALAEAHLRLFNVERVAGNREAALQHWQRAAEAEPNNPLVLSFAASDADQAGRLDVAVDLQRRALAVEPLSSVTRHNLAEMLLRAGRWDEALAESLRLVEANEGRRPDIAIRALILLKRYDEARALLAEQPDDSFRDQSLALIEHGLGRRAASDAALASLRAKAADKEPALIAEVHAQRGEFDAAFEWIDIATRRGAAEPGRQANSLLWWQVRGPYLKPLASDPRWESRFAEESPGTPRLLLAANALSHLAGDRSARSRP